MPISTTGLRSQLEGPPLLGTQEWRFGEMGDRGGDGSGEGVVDVGLAHDRLHNQTETLNHSFAAFCRATLPEIYSAQRC